MKKGIKTFLAILLVGCLALTLVGCKDKDGKNKKPTLTGQWESKDISGYIYTFNEDGTGTYNAGGTKMEFTYTTEDNKISILYSGNTTPFETTYSIDGDTLNIKDSFDKDTLYQRK